MSTKSRESIYGTTIRMSAFAGAPLCVQEEPLGCPAAAQDFSERPALNVVARRTMTAWASSGHFERQL
jgi:hypothetical protein